MCAVCYRELYVLAFTSGRNHADSDDDAYLQIIHKNGEKKYVKLYDRKGDDYSKSKGDLWKIKLSTFKFKDTCISKSDIKKLSLLHGGNDGWNIDSIVTFLKVRSKYCLLSRDFNIFRWLDGNRSIRSRHFDLTLVH